MSWDNIDLQIWVDAPLEVVLWHWSTEAGITRWFVPQCKFTNLEGGTLGEVEPIQVGSRYLWTWANGVTESGEILSYVDERGLSFTFGEGSTVVVELSATGFRTCVRLVQTTEGDEVRRTVVYRDCLQGWTFYLSNLKSVLEGGLDLRDLDPDREGLVNV